MRHYAIPIGLFAFWLALAEEYTPRLIISGLVASVVSYQIYRWLLKHAETDPVERIPLFKVFHYTVVLMTEICIATGHQILRVASGNSETEVFTVPLVIENNLAKALIANAVTLTPGTATIELKSKSLTILGYKQANGQEDVMRYVKKLETILRR